MKLETYINSKKMTDATFGALAGLSQSQVSRLRRGLSMPSKEALDRIKEATKGRVTANDFFHNREAAE